MKRIFLTVIFLLLSFLIVFSQGEKIYLWKNTESMKHQKTRLYVYLPPDSIKNGVSVIICPGGSYHHLGMPHEGYQVAEWLNSIGVTAYVLRYRVSSHGYHHPAMIEDIQMAISFVRENSIKYNIDPLRVGVMGFSAGGHLVIMAGAFYKENYLKKLGISYSGSLRPDFVVPVYPVVSMQDSLAHVRSRKNLLGINFTKEEIDKFSLELEIPDDMPPVFLVTAEDDPVVNFHNSVELDKALTVKGINHKFLLYKTGGHGYGLNPDRGGETAKWNFIFHKWLIEQGFIK
jgi:acetyl esterase/lipase